MSKKNIVTLMDGKNKSAIELVDDGTARLSIDYMPEILGPDVFVFCLSDGGGFSSVFCDLENLKGILEKLKNIVDDVKNNKNIL